MDKILVVPSNKTGDKIIQAYKDAGYKIKKPKHHKIKIKENKGILYTGNGIFEQIKTEWYIGTNK